MNNIKFSIVIPIYNVEQYIYKCIKSIQDQKYFNLEIICVDDCSTDSSRKIIEELKNEDSRIKLICHQKNLGLSASRNTGIKHCKGEYIIFLDSDDFLYKGCIKRISKELEDNSLEIMRNNFIYLYENINEYKSNFKYNTYDNNIINGKRLLYDSITQEIYQPMAWLNVYSREFLLKHELQFCEGIYHEDVEFTPRCLLKANKIKVSNSNMIVYRIRKNSITTTYNEKKFYDLLYIVDTLSDFVENQELDTDIKEVLYFLLCRCLLNVIENSKIFDEGINKKDKNIMNKRLSLLLKSKNSNNYIKYFIIKVLGIRVYRKIISLERDLKTKLKSKKNMVKYNE